MTEDKMVGWRHRLNGHEFGQALGAGNRQGEGEMNGESSMDAGTPTFVNRQPMGICCMIQGTQTGAQQ